MALKREKIQLWLLSHLRTVGQSQRYVTVIIGPSVSEKNSDIEKVVVGLFQSYLTIQQALLMIHWQLNPPSPPFFLTPLPLNHFHTVPKFYSNDALMHTNKINHHPCILTLQIIS